MTDRYECDECSGKPGSPELCVQCLERRAKLGKDWLGPVPRWQPGDAVAWHSKESLTGRVIDLRSDGRVTVQWDGGRSWDERARDLVCAHLSDAKLEPKTTVRVCCCCLGTVDHVWCYDCGGCNTGVDMPVWAAKSFRVNDEHRRATIAKQARELKALRRVAIDTYGPTTLGLRVEFTGGDDDIFGVRDGSGVVHCVRSQEGETDDEYLRRAGESASLDPELVRKIHASR